MKAQNCEHEYILVDETYSDLFSEAGDKWYECIHCGHQVEYDDYRRQQRDEVVIDRYEYSKPH